ncbi:MAG: hypothetical protein H7Y62_11330 [Hyphomicrobium sp.]|nr:hypothetical protein [Hyphomicrobium sp.]
MNKKDAIEIRDAFRDFCTRKDWTNPQAITLTLRLSRLIDGAWFRLSQVDAQQNLRHLRNVIHKRLGAYGYPKRAQLQCVPIFEGREGVRPHIHLMMDRPHCIAADEFADLIRFEWGRTFWGHEKVTIEPCHDAAGWLAYISKLRTKAEYADAIDWTNFR